MNQIKPKVNEITRIVNNKMLSDGELDIFHAKDMIELLADPDDQKITLKNVLDTLNNSSYNNGSIFIKNHNFEDFRKWLKQLFNHSSKQNIELFFCFQKAQLFSKDDLYKITHDMIIDSIDDVSNIDNFALVQQSMKNLEIEQNTKETEANEEKTEYVLDLNQISNIMLNNRKYLTERNAVALFSFPEVKNWNRKQKQQILSHVVYGFNQSNNDETNDLSFASLMLEDMSLASFILKNNREKGFDLSSEQIKQVLFNTFKTHDLELKKDIINLNLLNNDSQNLNLENRDIIELANQDKTILLSSKKRQELIQNSLKVNNMECACHFVQKQSDLDLKDDQGQTLLELAIERKNNGFLKYCVDQQWISASDYMQSIDPHRFNTTGLFNTDMLNHLIDDIPAFDQSPYQTSEQLLDQLENNDITKTDFKNFIASINSNSLKNEIMKSLLNDQFSHSIIKEEQDVFYFDLYDVACDMEQLDLGLVGYFIQNTSPLSGQEKNELINKLDSTNFDYLIHSGLCLHDFSDNYNRQDLDDLIQIVFDKTHGKLPIDYTADIIGDNEQFHYQDEAILSLLYKTDFSYNDKLEGRTVDDVKFDIGSQLIESNESSHFNIKGDQLLNALDLLKQPNEKTRNGMNFLMLAMAYNEKQNLGLESHHFEKLISRTNPHALTEYNQNSLMIALKYRYDNMACQLMDQGVDSKLTMKEVNEKTNQTLQEGLSVMEQAYVQKNEQFIQHCKTNQYNIETIQNIENLLRNNQENNDSNNNIQNLDSWAMKQLFLETKKPEKNNQNKQENNQENKVVSLFANQSKHDQKKKGKKLK